MQLYIVKGHAVQLQCHARQASQKQPTYCESSGFLGVDHPKFVQEQDDQRE